MRYALICLASLVLLSCAVNPFEEVQVTVVIEEAHPWRNLMHKPLWKTVVYTNGNTLERIHLAGGENSVSVVVACNRPTVICAYPLSSLNPWGGYYSPGSSRRVVLTQRQGALASLLLESWSINAQACETVNLDLLFDTIEDGRRIDQSRLLLAIFDGTLDRSSISYRPALSVTLTALVEGRWVSEIGDAPSFHALWDEEITISVGDGIQRWLNKERSLMLTLYTDLEERRYTTAVSAAPSW